MRRLLSLSLTWGVLAGCAAKPVALDGAGLSKEIGPYFLLAGPYLGTAAEIAEALGRKQEYDHWNRKYRALSRDQRIRYCIYELRNETNLILAVPMIVGSQSFPLRRYGADPERCPSDELIRIGKPAIPALIAALDDTTATGIWPSRPWEEVWRVQDAAAYVIREIACKGLVKEMYLGTLSEEEQARVRAGILDWWDKNKHLDEVAWAKAALFETTAEGAWYYGAQGVYKLYARLGQKCFPVLGRAYATLPPGSDSEDVFSVNRSLKSSILFVINSGPTARERPLLLRALGDAPLEIRVEGARGLWKLGDDTGLRRMVKEMEERHIPSVSCGDEFDCPFDIDRLLGFLVGCGTPESREAVYKCLRATDGRLRGEAASLVPRLRMEKAVRTLPELFDDRFIVSRNQGEPLTQVCDIAAQEFAELVPESPRFAGKTDEEQAASIRAIGQWYQANKDRLVWDGAVLRLKESGP